MLTGSHRRTVAGAVVVIVTGLGMVAGVASPAQAQASGVICTGTLSTTLSPGLRIFPQVITTNNDFIYSPCTAPSDQSLTYGTHSSTIVGVFACNSLTDSFSGTKTIGWSNGQTSTFAFNSTTSTAGAQFTTIQTGAITAGQFSGASATETIVGPTADLAECILPPGITNRTSGVTLVIAGTT